MHGRLLSGTGAILVVLIMFLGSLGMWAGTPLLWLYVGSQVQGATDSVGTAIGSMFVGAVATVVAGGALLGKLSDVYRSNRLARGLADPGHGVLEGVLVVSAGITLVAFVIWFFLFARVEPIPIGLNNL